MNKIKKNTVPRLRRSLLELLLSYIQIDSNNVRNVAFIRTRGTHYLPYSLLECLHDKGADRTVLCILTKLIYLRLFFIFIYNI